MAQIRRARAVELEALSALCLRSKAVHGYSATLLEAFRQELTLSHWDLDEDEVAVAVDDEDNILGIVQVSTGPAGCFLEKLFVEPDRAGAGVGRVLMDWACEAARRRGAPNMIIESDPGAVGFYTRYGAREAGTAPSESVSGRSLPRLLLKL